MKQEFVPYELAVKLKQLGFDEPCLASWIEKDSRDGGGINLEIWNDENTEYVVKSSTNVPLFQQAFRWFREKHNLISVITTTPSFDTMYASKYKSHTYFQFKPFKRVDGKYLINDTYEEAELAALDKLIKIVESKKQEQ